MSARLVSPVFVGRRAERNELIDALAAAADGATRFVLVGGEAGVGKSRLVAELVEDARARGVRVLFGQCVPLGADGVPYAPLADALRTLARTMPREEFDRALGPARRVLRRLLPAMDPEPDDDPIAAPLTQGAQLLELVLGMLERLAAEGPLLIVLEDLHWADQSTLDLVAYLVRAMRSVPIALVGTFRSDEMNRRHPLRTLLVGWQRARTVSVVELARLDRGEVAAQLAGILGHRADPSLLDPVFDRSEGNPFLVEEMLGVVRAGGEASALPQSLRDVLLTRVDGLGAEAQRLITVAAVGGRWVRERLLLAVSGMDETAAFTGLREAVEQHVLVVDDAGRGYSFRHALARDAVYDDLLPGQRGRLHAGYGQALTADPSLAGGDRTALAADLARHWYAALDLPRALAAALEAAAAAARFAPAQTLAQLERALQIWPQVPDAEQLTGTDHVDVLRRAGQAAHDAGAVNRALSLLGEALDELGEHGDPERRAGLMERRAAVLMRAGDTATGMAVLRSAAALLPADRDTLAHAAVFVELANATFRTGDWDEADRLARRAAAAARAAGADRLLVEAEIPMAVVQVIRGDHEGGVAAARAAIDAAVRLEHPFAAIRGFINLSDVLDRLGRSADAAELAAQGRVVAERFGYARSFGAFLAGNEAESLAHLGRYDDAARLVAAELAAEPEGVTAATLLDARCVTALAQGDYERARADLARARAVLGEQREPQYDRAFAITDVQLCRADGDLQGAHAILAAALAGPDSEPRYDWELLWLAFATHADRVRDALDRGETPPALEPVFAGARERLGTDIEPQHAYDLMCTAELDRAEGSRDAGSWHAAATLWRAMQRPYQLATCLYRAAATQALAGDRTGAQRDAAEAYALAGAIGAGPLAEEIARLSRRARLDVGAEPDTGASVDADPLRRFGLTQREDEVLAMVAEGRTNPDIAKALYISPKTASVHVSNILAKLGVTSRVEAATLAQRLRPPSV